MTEQNEPKPGPAGNSPKPPPTKAVREVRFAVVMYGGVSLAIYIHGVARELFHLVRATARKPSDQPVVPKNELEGAERVYRQLSHLLGAKDPSGVMAEDLEKHLDEAGPVRFVIDLISGTSAGGINGAFLAKALVHGQPIAPLRKLWLEQGDISTLLNDAGSVKDRKDLKRPRNPESLLNSQRMYLMLLDALAEMNPKAGMPSLPFVGQLDLFLTATDIRGVPLPIQLADRLVHERAYRHDYQFIYATKQTGTGRNDFTAEDDPILAFASRCTSSFPFAFEPAQWEDLEPLLKQRPTEARWNEWEEKFFRKYRSASDGLVSRQRSYGDGGYLDNKPFSYVTQALQTRRADLPVDRKLIYVEPSPEHPEEEQTLAEKPDALENMKAALLGLPRQETIREDIGRLQERNRLLRRVARIRTYLDTDIELASKTEASTKFISNVQDWIKKDVATMTAEFGPAYASYYRLKISDATDDLAGLVTRLFGLDPDSDAFAAVRALVAAWRDDRYFEYRSEARPDQQSQNQFLIDFNFSYRLRRLQFLLTRLSELEQPDESSQKQAERLLRRAGITDVSVAELRERCGEMRRKVNDLYHALRSKRRELEWVTESAGSQPLGALAKDLKFTLMDLEPILACPEGARRAQAAQRLYEARQAGCAEFAKQISDRLREIHVASRDECIKELKPAEGDSRSLGFLKRYLWYYFECFEDYDQFLYPLVFGTDSEETDPVEILRVSPEDADLLLNERTTGCHKLGGDSFGHFGGFLDPLWRLNDMLWGRLDAVERLVSALLPSAAAAGTSGGQPPLRGQLIVQAQAAIVADEIQGMGYDQARRFIAEGFMRTRSKQPNEDALRQFVAKLTNPQIVSDKKVRNTLTRYLELPALLDCYRQAFHSDRKPAPRPMLETAARATTIVGGMLDVLSEKYPPAKKPAGWFTRAGRIAWMLVELAVPDSVSYFLARHWLNVLYLCAVLVTVGGVLLNQGPLRNFGLTLFGVTLLLHLVLHHLNRLMSRGWSSWERLRRLLWATFVTLIVLLLLGVLGMVWLERKHLGNDLAELFNRIQAWWP